MQQFKFWRENCSH